MFVSSRTSWKWFSSVTSWRCKIKPIFTLAGRISFKRLDLTVIVRSILRSIRTYLECRIRMNTIEILGWPGKFCCQTLVEYL